MAPAHTSTVNAFRHDAQDSPPPHTHIHRLRENRQREAARRRQQTPEQRAANRQRDATRRQQETTQAITPTFRPWTHMSDDSYIYQLSLVVATATVSFRYTSIWNSGIGYPKLISLPYCSYCSSSEVVQDIRHYAHDRAVAGEIWIWRAAPI